jgi:hypothetical protein
MSAAPASRTFTTPTFIDIDDVKLNSGVVLSVRTITGTGTYTLSSTSGPKEGNDNIISVNTTDAVTIELPNNVDALVHGRTYTIHSTKASANITIQGNGKYINGNPNAVISVGYASLTFVYNSVVTTLVGQSPIVGTWFII